MEVDPQIQIQGETYPQSHQLPGQVLNPALGYSYQSSDIDRVKRFLCLGTELNYYRAGQQHRRFSRSEVQAIDRLIQDGRGEEVVRLIRDISFQGRACKQGPALYALAVCARSNDLKTKHAAYSVLGDVCRIPTHLFQFIKFCQEMSSYETGWGRAHRRAISQWYTDFSQPNSKKNPLKLAYLVTKYKSRYRFSHRDIIRLAHVKSKNRSIRMIIQNILKKKKKESAIDSESQEVQEFLEAVEQVKSVKTEEQLAKLIALHQLAKEHIPTRFLKDSLEVWKVLFRQMPMGAMIRNLGKMSELGMHETVDAKTFWVDLIVERLADDIALANARIHPFTLLVAFHQYSKGKSQNGKLKWMPNERIKKALEEAFYRLTEMLPPAEQRYLLAVSIGENMQKEICGSSIKASEAAASMVLSTVRKANAEVIAFSDKIDDAYIARIDKRDDVTTVRDKIFQIPRRVGRKSVPQDLSVPFKWSASRKDKFSAIIVYTDSITSCGNMHPAEAVKQYSQYMALPDLRLVVVSMTSDKYTIAAPDDINCLDVVGFDMHTPKIIMDFCEGCRQREPDMDVYLHDAEEDMIS